MTRNPCIPLAAVIAVAALTGCGGPVQPSPRTSTPALPGVIDPDVGGRIAFVQPRSSVPFATLVLIVRPDGSGRTALSVGNLSAAAPAWSPDGTSMAFQGRSRRSGTGIYTTGVAGAEPPRRLSRPKWDTAPDWSPDGEQIAFTRGRSVRSEIWVMNADGSHPVRLTHNRAVDQEPDWSPDGKRIAFTSGRDGNFEIYVMNADGSHPVRLTHTRPHTPDVTPAWSPDGRRIAWSSDVSGDPEIWVMDADGSGRAQLTHSPGLDAGPTWSPDGAWLAFASARGGDTQIWAMAADGSDPARLTSADNPPSFAPAWSARGGPAPPSL